MARNFVIDTPDFRAEAPFESRHDGRPVRVQVCYELIDGRWEGYVAMKFLDKKAR